MIDEREQWHDDSYDEDAYDPIYEEEDEEGNTIPCPKCSADVYYDAEQCPQCGYYLTSAERLGPGLPRWVYWTAVILLLLFLYNVGDAVWNAMSR
ncbi:MAG: hypothetical protein VXZ82_00765 [Planctomycetota bacterium]|nr:hypothetical protein [Planctomycetota bacterium]